jgi:hypothetical protein
MGRSQTMPNVINPGAKTPPLEKSRSRSPLAGA